MHRTRSVAHHREIFPMRRRGSDGKARILFPTLFHVWESTVYRKVGARVCSSRKVMLLEFNRMPRLGGWSARPPLRKSHLFPILDANNRVTTRSRIAPQIRTIHHAGNPFKRLSAEPMDVP